MEDGLSFLEVAGRSLSAYPEFNDSGRLFNQPPPSSTTSFIIGGVLTAVSIGMFALRVRKLMDRNLIGERHELVRGIIGCAIDDDSPYYTITSYSAVAFLFLGGIQEDYRTTFLVMVVYYFVAAFGNSLKVVMAFRNYESLSDVLLFNDMGPGLKEKKLEERREMHMENESMELQPTNIYEDIGREKTIVMMIFITQAIFISFVCVDVYRKDTTRCLDGTSGCPVGGTLGSYGFYILGVFQACVYLLGPKTSFGQSEQNPGYWLILLLAAKKNGAKLLWENPAKDPYQSHPSKVSTLKDDAGNVIQDQYQDPPRDKLYFCHELRKNDAHIWCRFAMSYLINGFGFHILVHALPIQVAAQSSLIGVVFRAVGMMYLVDLDDTAGLKLTIVENKAIASQGGGETDGDLGDEKIAGTGLENKTLDEEDETPFTLFQEPAVGPVVSHDGQGNDDGVVVPAQAHHLEAASGRVGDDVPGDEEAGKLEKLAETPRQDETLDDENETPFTLLNESVAGPGADQGDQAVNHSVVVLTQAHHPEADGGRVEDDVQVNEEAGELALEKKACEIIEEAKQKLDELFENGLSKKGMGKRRSSVKAGVMTFGYNGVGRLGGRTVKTPVDTAAAALRGSEAAVGADGGGAVTSNVGEMA